MVKYETLANLSCVCANCRALHCHRPLGELDRARVGIKECSLSKREVRKNIIIILLWIKTIPNMLLHFLHSQMCTYEYD